jgi:hypothetical protein
LQQGSCTVTLSRPSIFRLVLLPFIPIMYIQEVCFIRSNPEGTVCIKQAANLLILDATIEKGVLS